MKYIVDIHGELEGDYEIIGKYEERLQGDLISRKHLYRRIKTECNPYGKPTIDFESGKRVLDIIDNEPTVHGIVAFVERPKGEWRVRHDNHFRCTNCEQYSSFNFNYCPNCGADMRGEEK